MPTVLRTEGLRVERNGHLILQEIDITVRAASLCIVIGPNGAGKSTLLRSLCGLEQAESGRIILEGHGEITELSALQRARLIAWVPEHSEIPFAFSVRATVLMGRFPWHQGRPTASDTTAVEQALAQLGIDHLAHRPVNSLSSGERQKVMIARAVAGDAPILLFDEPLANLDIGSSLRLLQLLHSLSKQNRTLILTTHDIGLAERFADHGICLAGGRVMAGGTQDGPSEAFSAATLDAVFSVQCRWLKTEEQKNVPYFTV